MTDPLDPITEEKLAQYSLGTFLRNERESRGITVEQVASATKISVKILYSLEADQYSELPAKPFVRGFIASYAKFIGLNSKDVLTRFENDLDEQSKQRPTNDRGHSGYAFEKRDTDRSRTILWIVMGCFVVLGGLVLFVLKPALRHQRENQIEKLKTEVQKAQMATEQAGKISEEETQKAKEAVIAQAKPEQTSVPAKEAESSPPPATTVDEKEPDANASPPPEGEETAEETEEDPDPLRKGDELALSEIQHKIVFKALANVWVRYQVDGKELMRFMLLKDRLLVLKAKEGLVFQVSNANSMQYRNPAGKYVLLKGHPELSEIQETPTLLAPSGWSGLASSQIKDAAALPKTSDPLPEGEQGESTESSPQ